MTMATRSSLLVAGALMLAASTARPAEMRGRVLVDGTPAEGVTVSVLPFEDGARRAGREARGEGEPPPLAEGATGKDGVFAVAFEVPADSGEAPVRLRVSGGRTAPRLLARLVDPAGEVVGDVRLTSAETLAGRVQDERGGPVVGATVRLWAGRGGSSPPT